MHTPVALAKGGICLGLGISHLLHVFCKMVYVYSMKIKNIKLVFSIPIIVCLVMLALDMIIFKPGRNPILAGISKWWHLVYPICGLALAFFIMPVFINESFNDLKEGDSVWKKELILGILSAIIGNYLLFSLDIVAFLLIPINIIILIVLLIVGIVKVLRAKNNLQE